MVIVTIYTLYGRRAGAELCFEEIVKSMYKCDSNIKWIIFCNQQAENILKKDYPYVKTIYIPLLNNQYKKVFWLEFLSNKYLSTLNADCFWIPSGCNHFPGNWNIPVLTTFHDLGEYHIKNKYNLARTVYRKKICIPRSIKRSTAFTAVSEFTAKDMNKFLNIPLKQTNVIYNGSSPHSLSITASPFSILEKKGLQQELYFFTPGRTDYIGKGLDILLKSFREIHHHHPEIKLVLVGPEGEGHKLLLEDLSKDNYVDSHVLYLGRVSNEELVSLYSNCLSVIISSRFEGFGFPILEAITYNVPVICSDAGSLPEIAGDGALIFKSGDFNELTDKIRKIINFTPEQIKELKSESQKRLQIFTWKKCAQQMLDTFQKICNK